MIHYQHTFGYEKNGLALSLQKTISLKIVHAEIAHQINDTECNWLNVSLILFRIWET